jgi:hypothetical protein
MEGMKEYMGKTRYVLIRMKIIVLMILHFWCRNGVFIKRRSIEAKSMEYLASIDLAYLIDS